MEVSMKKKRFVLLMLVAFCVALVPTSALAVGWNYDLVLWDHWGSSEVTTAYPYLACTITNELGKGFARVEVKQNGEWKNALYQTPEQPSLSKNTKVTIRTPGNSSSVYRVFIWTQISGARGGVSCKGSY
jgi:hypothetical protein